MIFHLLERAWDIRANQHDGKPWTQKLSAGCPNHVGCVTRHYNTCMDIANGLYGSLAIIGEEFHLDENKDDIPELSVAKSKLKFLDVKQKARRKSGLAAAFRKKSTIVKYRRQEIEFSY